MNPFIRRLSLPLTALLLTACGGDGNHQDLKQYMAEQKQQTGGEIPPLPTAQPYKTAKYDAFLLRSPFEEPEVVIAGMVRRAKGAPAVKPDENRVREYLEDFSFSALSMMGSMTQKGQMWALLDDGTGTLHRVTVDNYIGKNHGRITSVGRDKLQVIEIVSDGKGGWLEKPRTLSLEVKE
ncbi:pilus assembly protein PilP [Porticoccus sp. W117]|uniref:pilus assembly protein PilP n=1 Tax=Porticoccus sp. W117 TaxID=3054777 RepID=UPI002598E936|nr:pilus assembly protein PilP [Porticoccus sp. W117]MDM3870920.1 pilus assembly protein PilP [Porticoccus sp. W117]